jgi:hypothetical protein
MNGKEFSAIRHCLGKTQKQLGGLLCISTKAVQSFEQGWRGVPAGVERQVLFLLYSKKSGEVTAAPCWERRNCPEQDRNKCAAWEFGAGQFCWFATGALCGGKSCRSWSEKIKLCRQCEVFNSIIPV